MIFGAWSIIYAIIQVLMSAINLNSIDSVLNANGVLNSFIGSGSMILLALVSVLFSICIAFIPYFASRIVRGEVGSTMLALGGAAITVASTAAALAGKAMMSGGAGFDSATSGGGNRKDDDGGGGGGGAAVDAGSRSVGYSSRPPRPPSLETRGADSGVPSGEAASAGQLSTSSPRAWGRNVTPGQRQSLSFAGSAFWQAGYSLGKLMGPRRSS
jgi:hypothetical protein